MSTRNIAAGLAQVQMGTQTAWSAGTNNTNEPNIDRARGGQIKVKLTIPSLTLKDSRGDSLTIPERICEFEIDLEQMPLVDVASYKVGERQTGPATINYPNGNIAPITGTFG